MERNMTDSLPPNDQLGPMGWDHQSKMPPAPGPREHRAWVAFAVARVLEADWSEAAVGLLQGRHPVAQDARALCPASLVDQGGSCEHAP